MVVNRLRYAPGRKLFLYAKGKTELRADERRGVLSGEVEAAKLLVRVAVGSI
jgi:hypothetical protein